MSQSNRLIYLYCNNTQVLLRVFCYFSFLLCFPFWCGILQEKFLSQILLPCCLFHCLFHLPPEGFCYSYFSRLYSFSFLSGFLLLWLLTLSLLILLVLSLVGVYLLAVLFFFFCLPRPKLFGGLPYCKTDTTKVFKTKYPPVHSLLQFDTSFLQCSQFTSTPLTTA